MASTTHSRIASNDSIASEDDNASVVSGTSRQSGSPSAATGGATRELTRFGGVDGVQEEEEEEDTASAMAGRGRKTNALEALVQSHRIALESMEMQIKEELSKLELANLSKLKELEEEQEEERANVLQIQSEDYEHAKAVQEKEILMEASVHDAEMKMLLERRILNSVLETVVDGRRMCSFACTLASWLACSLLMQAGALISHGHHSPSPTPHRHRHHQHRHHRHHQALQRLRRAHLWLEVG
jgi:hypothetical protein